jgi:hypothetical protein
MKRLLPVSLLLIGVLWMAGCSGHIPVDTYIPKNVSVYTTTVPVAVGQFTYEPISTLGMKSNQLENTAVGNVYLSTDVAELVREATCLELIKSGFSIKPNTALAITGDILKFKVDDLGYSIHWTYEIRYNILNKKTKQTVFSREYRPEMMKTRKLFASLATFKQFVHKVVLSGYELFINDSDVRAILERDDALESQAADDPSEQQPNTYSDEVVSATLDPVWFPNATKYSGGYRAFDLTITNKSTKDIFISWDKSYFLENGEAQTGFMFEGVRYIERDSSQKDTLILPGTTMKKQLFPNSKVIHLPYVTGAKTVGLPTGWLHGNMNDGEFGGYFKLHGDKYDKNIKLVMQID